MIQKTPASNNIVLFAFGFSGAAALIYEVIWTRAISLVLGSTTYALSTMLSTFMAGLAIGAYLGGKIADRRGNLIALFGICEVGIGIFGILTIPLIYSLPPLYLYIYRAFHVNFAVFLSIQFLLCSAIMIVPTTLMGMTFPFVSRAITMEVGEMGRKVGNAYAVNTFGSIIGAFSAGFILVPVLGIKAAVLTAGGINLMVGVIMLALFRQKKKIIPLLIIIFLLVGSFAAYSKEGATFITFYTAVSFLNAGGPIDMIAGIVKGAGDNMAKNRLYYKEHPEGSVRLYRDMDGFLILQTGGKIEGTAKKDIANTLLLAYLPLASHPEPKSFLVVGLGVGVTLMAAKEHVKDIDVVEINPGVIEAIKRFGAPGLLDNVNTYTDDARRYLFLTGKKYDIISSEPSYPAESAVANLFTLEYYRIAREKLNPGGVYCQWLPYYILTDEDMDMMLKTFGSVFKYVYLWKVGDSLDRLMVGSETPFSFDRDKIIERVAALNTTQHKLGLEFSREPRQVTAEISGMAKIPLNTDNLPHLEFNTVKNIIVRARN